MSLKEQLNLELEKLGLPMDVVGRKFVMKIGNDTVLTTGAFISVYVVKAFGVRYANFRVRTPLASYDDETERLEFSRDAEGATVWEYKLSTRTQDSHNHTTEVEIL